MPRRFADTYFHHSCAMPVWILLAGLVLSALCPQAFSDGRCALVKYQRVLRNSADPSCQPVKVGVGHCEGYCNSFARPSFGRPGEPAVFKTQCLCCSASEVKVTTVHFSGCKTPLLFREPTRCQCRSC